jgi:hypothetical protein
VKGDGRNVGVRGQAAAWTPYQGQSALQEAVCNGAHVHQAKLCGPHPGGGEGMAGVIRRVVRITDIAVAAGKTMERQTCHPERGAGCQT